MPRNAELDAAVAALNVATNTLGAGVTAVQTGLDGVSTRVFALTAKISTRMSDADVAAVKTALDVETNRIDNANVALAAIATSLTGVAVDPADPVPDPIPEPVPELPAEPPV